MAISEILSEPNSINMADLSKMDFCLIYSSNNDGIKSMIFICYNGANEINEDIWYSKDYPYLKNLVEELGFIEIDFGVFESKNAGDFTNLPETLLNEGLNYNEELETNILTQINAVINDILKSQEI